IEYLRSRNHWSHAAAIGVAAIVGCGAVGGVYAGGRVADGLLARDHLRARVWTTSCAYVASAALFLFGLLAGGAVLATVLFWLAPFALGAVTPPLDAARLDIMPPLLWGRAEGIRMMLRKAAAATAPAVFGYLADVTFGGGAFGIRVTFLVTLIP